MFSRHQIVALLLSFLLATSACNRQPAAPQHLTAIQVADRARPATVWIVTEVEATAEVPELKIDTTALQIASENRSSNDNSAAGRFRLVLNTLSSDPKRFLMAGSRDRTAKTMVRFQGSGIIFTPDGYIATNAHVVEPDSEELKQTLVKSESKWVKSDIESIEDAIHRSLPQANMTEDAKDRLIEAVASYYVAAGRLSDVSRNVLAVTSSSKSSENLSVAGVSCAVKKVGTPVPGKDVAILKMEGSDFPTLPLAQSLAAAGLRTGSEVHVIGFPGGITVAPDLTVPSLLEPSQTTGHVSAIRQMQSGSDSPWPVVQTDAAINPGNSGGPALDDKGEVIGLATFKLKDPSGEGVEGINFIVGVDVLQEFINNLSLKPATSDFTKKYLQALNDYETNRRSAALALFRELHNEHPGVRSVVQFLSDLEAPETAFQTQTPAAERTHQAPKPVEPALTKSNAPLIAFLLIAGVVVGLVVIVVFKNK